MSFKKKLVIRTKKDVILVMDNAGFHTANDCKYYYE